METIKEINIKNRTYNFCNYMINLDEFDKSKIKVDKKEFNDIDIYYLGYEHKEKISEYNVINSVNPLYLRIINMNRQFEKGRKYQTSSHMIKFLLVQRCLRAQMLSLMNFLLKQCTRVWMKIPPSPLNNQKSIILIRRMIKFLQY